MSLDCKCCSKCFFIFPQHAFNDSGAPHDACGVAFPQSNANSFVWTVIITINTPMNVGGALKDCIKKRPDSVRFFLCCYDSVLGLQQSFQPDSLLLCGNCILGKGFMCCRFAVAHRQRCQHCHLCLKRITA